MPRPPKTDPSTAAMPGAVYTPFRDRLLAGDRRLVPLHVGDTYLPPCDGARAEDLRVADHERLHNYSDTRGLPALVDALVEKVRSRNGLACERESVLVSAGATAGLG